MRRHTRTSAGLIARTLRPVALIGMLAGVVTTYADPDLWGHVRFGLDVLDAGHVAAGHDRYSFTADHPFLYHEWLGGAAMALAYRAGGAGGLIALKGLLVIAILALVWDRVRRLRNTWRWGGMALAAWGILPLAWTLRPQLWTALGIAVVCRVLTAGDRRALWTLRVAPAG